MGAGYVISGGTDAFAGALAHHLRAPVCRSASDASGPITSWIHLAPGSSGDETAALLAAVALAEEHLPQGEGASFIAVVPVWGVLAPPMDVEGELAAAAARALAQVRIEEWSRRGRRFNIVAYGAVDTASLPGLRPTPMLVDRTPMHRPGAIGELADAIDFLSSTAASYVTGSALSVDGGWTAYSWFYPARDL